MTSSNNQDIMITYDSRSTNEKIRFSQSYLEQICVAAASPQAAGAAREWHRVVDSYVRNHYVLKLVRTMQPGLDTQPVALDKMQELLGYALRLELDAYLTSDTRSVYYDTMAGNIRQIRFRHSNGVNNHHNLRILSLAASYVKRNDQQIEAKKMQQQQQQQQQQQSSSDSSSSSDTSSSSDYSGSSESDEEMPQQEENVVTWRKFIPAEMRNDFRSRLIKSIDPLVNFSDQRFERLHRHAISVENGVYETANSVNDYLKRLNEKIENQAGKVRSNDAAAASVATQVNAVSTTTTQQRQVPWRNTITREYRDTVVSELRELKYELDNMGQAIDGEQRQHSTLQCMRAKEQNFFDTARTKSEYLSMVNAEIESLKSNKQTSLAKAAQKAEAL